jgi:hypothetical protein
MGVGDERLAVLFDQSFGGDIRAFTADLAADVLLDEQAKGFDLKPVVIVDGRYGASPDDVKAFGKVEYAALVNVADAAVWAWEELFRRSPVDSGEFQDSIVMMVNGVTVNDLNELKPGERVQITDLQPYAGKIERGSSDMAPNGIFRAVASATRSRFRAVFVDFDWVKLDLNVRAKTVSKHGAIGSRAVYYPSIKLYAAPGKTAGDSDE